MQLNPQYNFEYQVADDDVQTYIAQNEARDGDDVTGEYSYVDPLGSLITVTYRAGIDGYTEERSVQENFVTIRAQPVRSQQTIVAAAPAAPAAPIVRNVVQQVRPAVQRVVTTTTSSSSANSAAADDGDLVARIIAQLTPFIRQTVTSSLNN